MSLVGEAMSVIETRGNASLVRIGRPSGAGVYNGSRAVAVVFNGKTIPLRWSSGDRRYEVSGANKQTALEAEVRGGQIYLLELSAPTYTYQVYRHSLKSGKKIDQWNTESRGWTKAIDDQGTRAIYGFAAYAQ